MDLVLVKNGGRYSLQQRSDSSTVDDSARWLPGLTQNTAQNSDIATSACLNSMTPDGMHQNCNNATFAGYAFAEANPQQRSMYATSDGRTLDQARDASVLSQHVEALSFSSPYRGSDTLKDSSDKLRGRLLDMSTSFVGFDKVIEQDSFRKRHVEQQRMQEVLDGLLRFEKTLNIEIRRRAETNKAVQDRLEQLLSEMFNGVQSRTCDRFDRLATSLDSLVERCAQLEQGIQQLKGELPTRLHVDGQALVRTMKDLTAELESEAKQKLDQDNHLLKVIEESERTIDMRTQQELDMLEKRCESLVSALDEFAREGDVPEGGKRAQIIENISRLRAAISEEARTRERTDDDVVQAINEYTTVLHRSLSKCVNI